MADQEVEYETYDIYLAAYFSVSGCKYLRKRKEGTRVFFIFTNTGGSMKEMRDAFYSNQGKAPCFQYSQQIIAFKQLCFEGDEEKTGGFKRG